MKSTYLIFLIVLCFIIGCKKHKLSKEDLKWQPYKEGDLLIFKSSKNKLDTIFITNIESFTNPGDHLAINPTYHQSLFVNGDVSLSEPRKQAGRLFYKESVGF